MSKITFRADDDLIDRLEAFDASKSEIMREALRAYLDERGAGESASDRPLDRSLDALVADRVDAVLEDRLGAVDRRDTQDVNVTVSLEGAGQTRPESDRKTPDARAERSADEARGDTACGQCGESIDADHVYCPNCGEKASHRVFCECGDELRSDWGFCPSCGRRTPAADVLDGR